VASSSIIVCGKNDFFLNLHGCIVSLCLVAVCFDYLRPSQNVPDGSYLNQWKCPLFLEDFKNKPFHRRIGSPLLSYRRRVLPQLLGTYRQCTFHQDLPFGSMRRMDLSQEEYPTQDLRGNGNSKHNVSSAQSVTGLPRDLKK